MKNNYTHYIAPALLIIMIIHCSISFSQVKIGDNPKSLNPDAMLEIESSNKGVLLPRVSLRSTSSPTPLKNFTAGMIVYNTSITNELTPGLYYCDGKKWIRANNNTPTSDYVSTQNTFWSMKGNNDVTINNFLGTNNNAPLVIRTNNSERMRVTEKGWIGIGTNAPKTTLHVKGQLTIDSINAGSLLTDKILVANPADGKIKYVSSVTSATGVQNYTETVASNGKTIFNTPSTITDTNKIFLYRNGVLISFTLNNSNSIISELPCNQGDQIRIIQLL